MAGAMALTFRAPAAAQRPVTLAEAVSSALGTTPRIAAARADSALGAAAVIASRAWPNPDLALGYSKSPPQYHLEMEQPFEYPGIRAARRRAAEAEARASTYALEADRAAVRYAVEIAYARAAGRHAIQALSDRNAAAADELLRITRARQDAGDASELDVRVAAVFAGQTRNEAFADSLDAITSVLILQSLMGLPVDDIVITPADSLASFTPFVTAAPASPLRVAAAGQRAAARRAGLELARKSRIPAPALRAGIETHDPAGDETGILPTFGLAIALPLWNRGRADVAQARAVAARAEADLRIAQLETATALATARRERDVLRAKVERGRDIVAEAERVAELANTAYREGAYPLASVLEAQRSARDALRQFIEDLEASRIAEATFARAVVEGGTGT